MPNSYLSYPAMRSFDMTPEARLDRLERISKLFVRAGRRYRHNLRSLDEKINIIVDSQIKNDERLSRAEQELSMLSQRTERLFSQLAESQANTDRRLNSLIDLVNPKSIGDSSCNN
jgi:hypothetical protein